MTQTIANDDFGEAVIPGFSRDWALFLDVDGTLVEIAESPHAVATDRALLDLLARLHDTLAGSLALVSGRAIADLDRLFTPLRFPIAGQHGTERRDAAGAMHTHSVCGIRFAGAKQAALQLVLAHPALLLEDKGLTLALHYRQAPDLEGLVERFATELMREMGEDFQLGRGKMVFEIKPSGRDKGGAIREFMAEPPFRGRLPVFIGDDVTDEFGFRMVNELGGYAVKVGPGPSAAPFRLPSAAAVRRWLSRFLAWAEDARCTRNSV